jgi:ring-1,2-phenylacetyl-CoA epoxidase subunit PaaD
VVTAALVRSVLAGVHDPEIPVITIEDLGILRDVAVEGSRVVVTVTPTYSGCPAMDEIRADIVSALAASGVEDVEVRTVLAPAWTTGLDERGRQAQAAGVRHRAARSAVRRAGAAADPPAGVVPAVRLQRHRGDDALRLHLLQVDVAVPVLPRAVRPLQGALT